MEQRISLITLGVHDLEKARAFYEEMFGWVQENSDEEGIAFYRMNGLDGLKFALYPFDALAEDAGQAGAQRPEGFSGVALAYNLPSRDEVDHLMEQIAGKGGKVLRPAQEVFWGGGYTGYIADIDGYAWEIAYNPHWKFDE